MDAKEASDMIEKAIEAALTSNEDYVPGDILMDWVVIAFTANPDKEAGSSYPMFFRDGQMPDYRARGLLAQAMISNLGE